MCAYVHLNWLVESHDVNRQFLTLLQSVNVDKVGVDKPKWNWWWTQNWQNGSWPKWMGSHPHLWDHTSTFPTCSSNCSAGGSMRGRGLLLSRTSVRSNLKAPSMCWSRYSWCASRFKWGRWKLPGINTCKHTICKKSHSEQLHVQYYNFKILY